MRDMYGTRSGSGGWRRYGSACGSAGSGTVSLATVLRDVSELVQLNGRAGRIPVPRSHRSHDGPGFVGREPHDRPLYARGSLEPASDHRLAGQPGIPGRRSG